MDYSRRNIINAISQASRDCGVDFSYLLNQAAAESNFEHDAKASTSSARGLYQFIDSTWLNIVERYGQDYGIKTDGKSKEEILDMRNDPEKSSFMAAAFALENEKFLNNKWGGKVGATELYFAHFLGASGAAKFLNAHDENPSQRAADLFPQAARANKNVFFDAKSGKARTMSELYAFFDNKFNAGKENNMAGETLLTKAQEPSKTVDERKSVHKNLYTPSRTLSDSIIMQRAQAMRDAARSRSTYARALYYDGDKNTIADNAVNQNKSYKSNISAAASTPLSGILAQPLDIMMLAQLSTPGKIIDDSR